MVYGFPSSLYEMQATCNVSGCWSLSLKENCVVFMKLQLQTKQHKNPSGMAFWKIEGRLKNFESP